MRLLLATQEALTRIPAEPPLRGPFWTLVVPALLLLVAGAATAMLYRKFAGR